MLSVARLKRVRTGAFKARKALPEDIRETYAHVYGQKWEAIFWAPAGTPPDQAKLLHAEWLVEVERRVMTLRGAPRPVAPAARSVVPPEPPTAPAPTTSASDLFKAYCRDAQPANSTMNRWQAVFTTLDGENWRAPGWSAQRWMDSLKTEDRSAVTVRDVWLSAARTVCGWAVDKRRLKVNPFVGVKVTVPTKAQHRETGKEFTEGEALTILQAASAETANRPNRAAKRWVPWLCAYTGARVGEITQCHADEIEQRGYGLVLHITPEAGTVKTAKARTVPLHPHLVEMGFLRFVEEVRARLGPKTPLFYKQPKRPSRNPNYRGPAVKAREKLAAWVRELGVKDPEVQPNHAWRHTFKRRAARAGIEANIRDGMCGHSYRTVADMYEAPSIEDLAAAMEKFPRWSDGQTGRRERSRCGSRGRRNALKVALTQARLMSVTSPKPRTDALEPLWGRLIWWR